jgi:hypothetical protein
LLRVATPAISGVCDGNPNLRLVSYTNSFDPRF